VDADRDPARGVLGITTAAELVGTGVQNLRAYEARGLIRPDRTPGGTRRYSQDDLDRLRHIGDLLADGLNLAGISAVLELEAANQVLKVQLASQRGRSSRGPARGSGGSR
jgi:MerR family transcriptional regulator, heat shock protein HspR